MTTSLADRFVWHPDARIVQTAGDLTDADALAAAFARAALGLPFRIGGGAEPPRAGIQPMFETLTSGSSAAPRRIWRSQASWIASFAINARMFGIGPGTKVAVLGQLVHSLSLYGALEALHLGATLHLLPGLRPDRQRKAMAAGKVAVLYATPGQARLLIEGAGPDLPDLRVILIGGSKLDAALRTQLGKIAPNATLREFYGAAETSFLTLAMPDDPPDSVGRPYPGVRIDIRGATGASLPDGVVGEIWAQSPYLFQDYSADPGSATWSGDWLSVGEIGFMINGLVTISGRKDRAVQIADQTVYPEVIEGFMAALPGITRIAVIPEPDAKRGAILLAVAMGDATQEAAILAATRGEFGALKCPRRIFWRGDWPVLASGKTDLTALTRGLP